MSLYAVWHVTSQKYCFPGVIPLALSNLPSPSSTWIVRIEKGMIKSLLHYTLSSCGSLWLLPSTGRRGSTDEGQASQSAFELLSRPGLALTFPQRFVAIKSSGEMSTWFKADYSLLCFNWNIFLAFFSLKVSFINKQTNKQTQTSRWKSWIQWVTNFITSHSSPDLVVPRESSWMGTFHTHPANIMCFYHMPQSELSPRYTNTLRINQ